MELSNHIAIETQKGQLEITRVKNEQTKTEADAKFYAKNKEADSLYYEEMKKAEAAAQASELEAVQRAKNMVMLADAKKREIDLMTAAFDSVTNDHVKRIQLEEIEVQKRKSLPAQTIYFAGGEVGGAANGANAVAEGYAFSIGRALATKALAAKV